MIRVNRIRKQIGRLHIIINSDGEGRPTFSPIELTRQVLAGGADTIQYRNKSGSMREMIEEATQILQLCRKAGIPCIINDRVDLCLALDADGVHLGKADMPVPIARKILGGGKVIGATVRNVAQRQQVEEESADYVGFGPIFQSYSKELEVKPFGLDGVREVSRQAKIPVIGIAGITVENCREVITAGASGVAVIGAVANAANPAEAVRTLSRTILQATKA
ncbi:MAG: thiamine phosphate synthase [Ignavibacteriae bacterium]|nr:thiamine phosphate synthase [Ignavibacteriota bacterium]MCB9217378.1 thiamine phosphate synthase [Ignavibacteria bacterium]